MLSANTIKRLEGIEKSSKQGHKVKDLYRMLINHEDLWVQAYLNIEGNKGA